MKILNPTIHGVLDYVTALTFLLAPSLFGFSPTAAMLSYVIGATHITASIITKYPLGLIKLLPFPIHGVIETIMAVGFIVFPWLFGFADDIAARNFYVAVGVGLLVVVALTDYKGTKTRSDLPRHA